MGASHAILVLGELGLLHLVLPEAAVAEVRRNLAAKLTEAAPLLKVLFVLFRSRSTARQRNGRARSPPRRTSRSSRQRSARERASS